MSGKGKPAHGGNRERAKMETAALAGATFSKIDCTTPTAGRQLRIADLLLDGEENAIPLRELKNILHLDGRTVRLMIRTERLLGVPILANNMTGYYLPGNDQERAQCVRSMRRRAAEIIKVAEAIERSAGID